MAEDTLESTQVDTPNSSEGVSTEPAGDTYTVAVDGDNQEVSLQELRDGYQRQADYTRKTQELASERRRLEQAEAIVSSLEADPEGTIKALGNAFGVQAEEPKGKTDEYSGWTEEPDVTDKRIGQLEAKVAAQDRVHRRQSVERQVGGLKRQYGDFDAQSLFRHAVKHKINNLEAALTHMQYGDVAQRAGKLEKEQERLGAKRDASVVEPGGSKQAGSASEKAPAKASSIREAFNLAKKQHT